MRSLERDCSLFVNLSARHHRIQQLCCTIAGCLVAQRHARHRWGCQVAYQFIVIHSDDGYVVWHAQIGNLARFDNVMATVIIARHEPYRFGQ